MLLFCNLFSYSQQTLDTIIFNKKGEVYSFINNKKVKYNGAIHSNICMNSKIQKYNFGNFCVFTHFILSGDYLNSKKIYGEEFVEKIKNTSCNFYIICQIENGKINGEVKWFLKENNQLIYVVNYKDGVKNGIYKYYYSNGSLLKEGYYSQNKFDGREISYTINGEIGCIRIWDNGIFVSQEVKNKIFSAEIQ